MREERPATDDLSQDEQAALLVPTGNGRSIENEEQLLFVEFGAPDENGVYGAPEADEAEGGDA